jgi:hypothetical protein
LERKKVRSADEESAHKGLEPSNEQKRPKEDKQKQEIQRQRKEAK